MSKLIAFHGSQEEKDKAVATVREHREMERLIQGSTGRMGADGVMRGCAVFCTVGRYSHSAYESAFGIPQLIAHLEDGIFEGLPKGQWETWPERFLQAIQPGADLSRVGDQFMHWLLVDPTDGVIKFAKDDRTKKAIADVGELYAQRLGGNEPSADAWRQAEAAAAVEARWAARWGVRTRQSEKLLELLAAAPVVEAVEA